jgi:hypothetical protein
MLVLANNNQSSLDAIGRTLRFPAGLYASVLYPLFSTRSLFYFGIFNLKTAVIAYQPLEVPTDNELLPSLMLISALLTGSPKTSITDKP